MWYAGNSFAANNRIGCADLSLTTALITRLFTDADGNGSYTAGTDTLLSEDLVNGLAGTTVNATVGQVVGIEGAGQTGFTVQSWTMDFENDGVDDLQGTGAILGLHSYGTAGSYTAALEITYTTGATIGTSVTINVQDPPGGGSAWIVENQIRSGRSIAGDCVPFKINAAPSSLLDDAPTLEAWNGSNWVDLSAFVTQETPTVNSGLISLDVTAAIAAGTLTDGNATPFRTRVGSVASANNPGASQSGLQGLILLTPTTGSADVVGSCSGRPDYSVAVSPDRGLLAELGADGLVELLLGTVTTDCTLRLFEPAGGDVPTAPGGTEIVVVRDISLVAGGAELTPGRAVRVRLFYKDADQDGKVDNNTAIAESGLRIVHFTGGGWVELSGMRRNDVENWVEGTTTGFSEFALVGDVGGGGGSGGGGGCSARRAGSTPSILPLFLVGALALFAGFVVKLRRE